MGNGEHPTKNVTDHPLLLTIVLLYSIVIGLPLDDWPPIRLPVTPSDLFIFSVVILALARIVLTFFYASGASTYPGKIFALEVIVAFIFVAQFRVLLDSRVNSDSGSPLALYYWMQLLLIGTMIVWSFLNRHARPMTVIVLRLFGLGAAILGLGGELIPLNPTIRSNTRYLVAGVFVALALVYGLSAPWRKSDSEVAI